MKLSTRLTIAMVALVLTTAIAIGSLIYYHVAALALPRVLERIDVHAHFLALDLESSQRGARSFVEGFRSAAALDGMMRAHAAGGIDPEDGVTEATWRNRMAARYLADLAARPDYLQIRLIGTDGRELIRVERSEADAVPRIASHGELQDKSDARYFKSAIGFPPGQVYVSSVEHARTRSAAGLPPVPVFRVAAPVLMTDGRPFGIMVVNIELRPAFDRIRASSLAGARVYVVNEEGIT